MNNSINFFIILMMSVTIANSDIDNKDIVNCKEENISLLLSENGLDPMIRNKKIWKRLLRKDNFLMKYGIEPNTEYQKECIHKYILHNAFNIQKYSRELGR